MTLKQVFEKSVQFFKEKNFESARLESEMLLSHALKIDRVQIYVRYDQPLSEVEITNCREAVRRRATGEPVAYIVEEKGFYGLDFKVGPGVLIPRPETELIVEEALKYLKQQYLKHQQRADVLDLGAGSGCIGLSILKNHENAHLVAIEKSDQAFAYLQENTVRHKLSDRVQAVLADIAALADAQESPPILQEQIRSFDVIVANPPYISKSDDRIEVQVKQFEPHLALFAEDNGLKFIKNWLKCSLPCLKSSGLILYEIGCDQGPAVMAFANQQIEDLSAEPATYEVSILRDLAGLDRVLKILKK